MKKNSIFQLANTWILLGNLVCSVQAQTAGTTDAVRFEWQETPVMPSTSTGSPYGFIHATYTYAAWGDCNNDGCLDLFYSDKNNHGNATKIQSNFYLNKGDQTFKKPTSPFGAVGYSCPVWLDVNNDGLLDLFLPGLGNWSYQWNDLKTSLSNIQVHLYINQGIKEDGTPAFQEIPAAETGLRPVFNGKSGGKGHNWAAAGDYDNDGFTDLLVEGFDEQARAQQPDYEEAVRTVYLYRNIQGSRFELQPTPLNGKEPFHGLTDGSVCFADLDNDGWLDILTTGYGYNRTSEVHLYWNGHDGTFSESEIPFGTTYNSSCDVCDLNNDGLADLVMTGVYFENGQKQFCLYKNLGNRSFQRVESDGLLPIDGGQLAFGDVNHDGLTDMLASGHNGTYEHTTWLYLNKGDFQFEGIAWYNQEQYGWAFSRITHGNNHLIDYNNDGRLDAWISGWSNGKCSKGCDTELWKNNSATEANEPPSAPTGLKATLQEGTNTLLLSWTAATDEVTPSAALRYNIFLKNSEGTLCYQTIPADTATGFLRVSRLSAALAQCSASIQLRENGTYEWGVQAIDNGNRGSRFARSVVSVDAVDGLPQTNADRFHFQVEGNTLYYQLASAAHLKVLRTDGTLVYEQEGAGCGQHAFSDKGIYLLVFEETNSIITKKISIR